MRKKLQRKLVREIADEQPQIEPRCPYFGKCGGCFMQDVDYEHQRIVKQKFLQKLFDDAEIEISVPLPEPSPDIFYYRNRMDFPIGENQEIGLKPMGRWMDVLNLEICFLQSEASHEIMDIVRGWIKKWKLPGWNVVRHTGYARYLVIREGKNTGERMVIIVTSPDPSSKRRGDQLMSIDTEREEDQQEQAPLLSKEGLGEVWDDLVEKLKPLATTIYHAINPRLTDISIGDEMKLLHGEPLLKEEVNGLTYFISPFSFFQTNTKAAALLQEYVVSLVIASAPIVIPAKAGIQDSKGMDPSLRRDDNGGRDDKVLDLYCGSGFFTLPLAKEGVDVVGVELDPASIKMAEKNAKENNITSATFHATDAKLHTKELQAGQYDTIIVDPPRAGLHPKVIRKLIEIAPQEIIYVSCGPARLTHELSQFLEHFNLTSIKTFDMFPHTPHVETVITLKKKAPA
ncbi:MAG: hypothetical protein CMI52_03035 [Parcubacteria group bacterium]|nr:hypothetical protein [Parcubacteria group bacterium]